MAYNTYAAPRLREPSSRPDLSDSPTPTLSMRKALPPQKPAPTSSPPPPPSVRGTPRKGSPPSGSIGRSFMPPSPSPPSSTPGNEEREQARDLERERVAGGGAISDGSCGSSGSLVHTSAPPSLSLSHSHSSGSMPYSTPPSQPSATLSHSLSFSSTHTPGLQTTPSRRMRRPLPVPPAFPMPPAAPPGSVDVSPARKAAPKPVDSDDGAADADAGREADDEDGGEGEDDDTADDRLAAQLNLRRGSPSGSSSSTSGSSVEESMDSPPGYYTHPPELLSQWLSMPLLVPTAFRTPSPHAAGRTLDSVAMRAGAAVHASRGSIAKWSPNKSQPGSGTESGGGGGTPDISPSAKFEANADLFAKFAADANSSTANAPTPAARPPKSANRTTTVKKSRRIPVPALDSPTTPETPQTPETPGTRPPRAPKRPPRPPEVSLQNSSPVLSSDASGLVPSSVGHGDEDTEDTHESQEGKDQDNEPPPPRSRTTTMERDKKSGTPTKAGGPPTDLVLNTSTPTTPKTPKTPVMRSLATPTSPGPPGTAVITVSTPSRSGRTVPGTPASGVRASTDTDAHSVSVSVMRRDPGLGAPMPHALSKEHILLFNNMAQLQAIVRYKDELVEDYPNWRVYRNDLLYAEATPGYASLLNRHVLQQGYSLAQLDDMMGCPGIDGTPGGHVRRDNVKKEKDCVIM